MKRGKKNLPTHSSYKTFLNGIFFSNDSILFYYYYKNFDAQNLVYSVYHFI